MSDTGWSARGRRIKRLSLSALMALVALNVWTGSPLLALWVGSQVQGGGPPTMGAVFVVIAMVCATSLLLLAALARLAASHDRLTGAAPTVRRHVAWLRSMRGEREVYPGERPQVTMLERILVAMVVAAVLAFEIWFFLFSGSPIDQRSGRSALAPDSPAVAAPGVANRA